MSKKPKSVITSGTRVIKAGKPLLKKYQRVKQSKVWKSRKNVPSVVTAKKKLATMVGHLIAGKFQPIWSYKVTSSNLDTVEYDPFNFEMRIRFLSGGLYAYYDVPLEEFIGLVQSPSHGHYFWANVRDPGLVGSKQYRYSRIE